MRYLAAKPELQTSRGGGDSNRRYRLLDPSRWLTDRFRSRLTVRIHLAPPTSLSIIGHSRELREIRACARDLPSHADPERGVVGANRSFSRILSARDFPMSDSCDRRRADSCVGAFRRRTHLDSPSLAATLAFRPSPAHIALTRPDGKRIRALFVAERRDSYPF
jgi:hypothetical protein